MQTTLLEFLIRATILLTLSGLVLGLVLHVYRCKSSVFSRLAWAFVLLCGVLCFRLPLEIPILPAAGNAVPLNSISNSFQEPGPWEKEKPAFPQKHGGPMSESSQKNETRKEIFSENPAETATFVAFHGDSPDSKPSVEAAAAMGFEDFGKPQTSAPVSRLTAVSAIFGLWSCGVICCFTVPLFFWLREIRRANAAAVPEGFYRREWETLLKSYGIDSRRIELRILEHGGPGLLRSFSKHFVLVPETLWKEAPKHVRLGILKHELSHYRHHDLWTSTLLRLIPVLHWFNPVAHYAARKFDEAAEWRCDAEAFGTGENAVGDFAETMLLFRDTVPIVFARRTAFYGNNIRLRAERLIEFTQHKGDSPMKKLLIVSCCAVLLFLGLFQIRFTEKQAQSQAQTPPQSAKIEPEIEEAKPEPTENDESWKIIPPEMKVIVKNEAGEPISDVELDLNMSDQNKVYNQEKKTDENGVAILNLSELIGEGKEMQCFRLWIVPKNRYVGQFFGRDRLNGQRSVVPSEQVFTVKPGITFGGVVVDEHGNPIPEAGIRRYYDVSMGFGGFKADAEGKWSVDTVNPNHSEYEFQILHPDYLDLDVKYKQGTPEMERLRNGTERFVMKKGFLISGKIVDSENKPIENAKVELGHQNRAFYQQGKEYYQETKTDAQGKYEFPSSPGGSKNMIVSAPGCAPQIRQLEIKGNLEQDFQLKPGNSITFKIVDSESKPIEGAYIDPYNWQGSEGYMQYWKLGLKTDANGLCTWSEAPEGMIRYFVGKRGMLAEEDSHNYEPQEEPQKEPYVITLHPQPVFKGSVVDKETKEPIKNFTVVPGIVWTKEKDDRVIWHNGGGKAEVNGTYTVSINSVYHAVAIRIVADGYLPSSSEAFVGVQGEKVVDFELIPTEPISGVILSHDGKPVENAEVRICDSANGREDIFRNELTPRYGEKANDYMRTKSDGKFSFSPREEGFIIIVAHDDGCALAFRDDVKQGPIRLKPWARVELMLMKGKEPRSEQAVSLFGGGYSCGAWDPEKPMPLFQTPYTSDTNGKVVAENVFPDIPYWIEMRDRKFGDSSMDSFAPSLTLGQTKILPEPGKTSQVQIGGVGSPVIGKILVPEKYRKQIKWDFAKVTLSSIDTTKPKPDYAKLPIPKEIDRNDRLAVLRWFYKWQSETEEGKAFKKLESDYNMNCDEESETCPIVPSTRIDARISADGSFRVEDVPGGSYKIEFESFQPKDASEHVPDRFNHNSRDTFNNSWTEPTIIVPDLPEGLRQSEKPFDAGTINTELEKM